MAAPILISVLAAKDDSSFLWKKRRERQAQFVVVVAAGARTPRPAEVQQLSGAAPEGQQIIIVQLEQSKPWFLLSLLLVSATYKYSQRQGGGTLLTLLASLLVL